MVDKQGEESVYGIAFAIIQPDSFHVAQIIKCLSTRSHIERCDSFLFVWA